LLGHVQARILPPPELPVARARERFDAGLRLKDEGTSKVLGDLLALLTGGSDGSRRRLRRSGS
jgi:hypothetical protein